MAEIGPAFVLVLDVVRCFQFFTHGLLETKTTKQSAAGSRDQKTLVGPCQCEYVMLLG